MNTIIDEFKKSSQTIISHLKEDLKSIRTGRASPAVLEDLIIETYGGQSKMKLLELSTITTEGPSQLVVMPYDPSTVQDIERAILKSPLSLTPQTQGTRIIVKIPPLSEEQRHKLTKIVNQKIEEKKVQIRGHRDEARKKIKHQLEAKEITEDQKYRLEKDVDTQTQGYMGEIDTIKQNKEKEIMEV